MSKGLDFTGEKGFRPRGFLHRKPNERSISMFPGRHADVYYFPPRKRSRLTAPFIISEIQNQPSIEILPDECLFEVFRRLPEGQGRSACASVCKRFLMLSGTISRHEYNTMLDYTTSQTLELDSKSDYEKFTGDTEKGESRESDLQGSLTRCLEGNEASDVRLCAISVGTASRGGLGKLSIRGDESTCRLTDFGLRAVSCGSPRLKILSLWNLSLVSDDGLSTIATRCCSLEKLDLCHCPGITDEPLVSISRNCPRLDWVILESCPNIGNESLKALGQNCPNLKSITLKNCPLVDDRGISGLFTSAKNGLRNVNLQSIKISDLSLALVGHRGPALTDLTLRDLRNVSQRGFWVMGKDRGLKKLRSLSIASCPGISDVGLDALGQNCPDLKTVTLRKCPLVSDNGVVSFARAARLLESLKLEEIHRLSQFGIFSLLTNCNRKLKTLSLVNCLGIKDVPVQFSSWSTVCDSLRSLTVHRCLGVGNFGLGLLGRVCPNLTHVDLTGLGGITDSGIRPLFQRSESRVVKVTLNGCKNLTDDIVSEITKIHGGTLEVLSLEGCDNLTDATLIEVAKNCSILSELDVSKCGITDYGIGILAGAKQLGIRILSLAGCPSVSGGSLPFLGQLGKTMFGLNIQHCSGMSSGEVNLLIEQLWRCDILT